MFASLFGHVSCYKARRLMMDFIDMKLPPKKQEAVKEHVNGCVTCRFQFASELSRRIIDQGKQGTV